MEHREPLPSTFTFIQIKCMATRSLRSGMECWGELNDTRASLPWAQSWCGILGTPPQLGSELGSRGFRCLHYSVVEPGTLRPSVGRRGQSADQAPSWHSVPFVGESYVCWDFTNSKRCKIPAIQKARVCDGIEVFIGGFITNIHNGELYYMVAEIGIFMCCLYFTSN